MRAEDYQRRRQELAGWPVGIVSYKLGDRFICEIDNVEPRSACGTGRGRHARGGRARRHGDRRAPPGPHQGPPGGVAGRSFAPPVRRAAPGRRPARFSSLGFVCAAATAAPAGWFVWILQSIGRPRGRIFCRSAAPGFVRTEPCGRNGAPCGFRVRSDAEMLGPWMGFRHRVRQSARSVCTLPRQGSGQRSPAGARRRAPAGARLVRLSLLIAPGKHRPSVPQSRNLVHSWSYPR